MSDKCSDYLEQIVFLLDNELDDRDIEQVRAHLADCSPCNDSYSVQLTMKTIVARSCAEHAPDGLRQRILFALQQLDRHE